MDLSYDSFVASLNKRRAEELDLYPAKFQEETDKLTTKEYIHKLSEKSLVFITEKKDAKRLVGVSFAFSAENMTQMAQGAAQYEMVANTLAEAHAVKTRIKSLDALSGLRDKGSFLGKIGPIDVKCVNAGLIYCAFDRVR